MRFKNLSNKSIKIIIDFFKELYEPEDLEQVLDTNNIKYNDVYEAAAKNYNLFNVDEEQLNNFAIDFEYDWIPFPDYENEWGYFYDNADKGIWIFKDNIKKLMKIDIIVLKIIEKN